jgi:LmbE family N-acetylglucosaminyl deacetylase
MFIKNIIKRARIKKENSILMKRFIDYADLFFNSEITLYPKLLTDIKWDRILVLTPHADDETFGAGGFISAAVAKNKKVKIVLYSDNSESIIASDNRPKDGLIPRLIYNGETKNPNRCGVKSDENITQLRSAEFGNAMSIVGITEKEELKISPLSFVVSNELIEKTKNIISNFSPSLILLPSFIDNHEEHKILNKILANSLDLNFKIDVMLFEVWTPISPNIIIKISEEMNKKMEAIKCYASQIDYIDYESSIKGLNKYRSIYHFQGKEFCEAFILLSSSQYISLVLRR